jgi:hypothetical protein
VIVAIEVHFIFGLGKIFEDFAVSDVDLVQSFDADLFQRFGP